ncbi:glycine cleavage system H protein [Iodidimonas muriae]|uniref:Glycine cleavage system H protein n=1 Tax=Iodidimonas muriae TaxID=261467 RepID=A0ABQ2LD61_9PROT|nr:glycine cleavage system protein GcvH [Iodidimonas muriae]GER07243.1 glycine cleavage system H protein [Kordiimonadales bacterium JCM 17843]GGO11324.1 glycine cleavage system H protein [Iodidimonas muriae]
MTMIRYSEDHEWVRVEDGKGTVGITDYAQAQLGDVVFVELPEKGATLTKGDEAAVVESVKAASELYAPVSGEIIGLNTAVVDEPATVNTSPLDAGWFFEIALSDPSELDDLMDEDAYEAFVKDLG